MKSRLRNHLLAIVFFGLLLLLLAFKIFALTQQDNVREAAVRAYLRDSNAKIVFVSIDEHDPDAQFINRFRGHSALVRPTAAGFFKRSLIGDVWDDHFIDKSTGLRGQQLSLYGLSWRGPLMAQIEVGHPGKGERFTLVWGWHGWVMWRKEMTVIV